MRVSNGKSSRSPLFDGGTVSTIGPDRVKLPRRNFLHLAAGAAVLPVVSPLAWAQAYPTRPVRFIIGYPPGGAADITARLMGQWLSDRLAQPLIIESRPGASTNIAAEAVVHAPPDGYTLLLVAPANAINVSLYHKLPFDFIRDIAPVAGLIRFPNVVIVNPSVPARQTQHGVGRQRVYDPCVGGTVQDDDRHHHGPCAISRRRAGVGRPDQRACPGDI
jgi:Tripartite tricarboxylate transporter family receptor